ncbi:hypothetical protein RIR_jg12107.t1 [Rhizophagus irregularis DAOM 181602=DAOM 197198]|nr:hypothetical protein RIR_jg12107.t1 [Rhizophagus irregularis DAOM 181602=DAOM 197198]
MHAIIVSALRLHLFAAIKSVPPETTGMLYRPDLKFTRVELSGLDPNFAEHYFIPWLSSLDIDLSSISFYSHYNLDLFYF